MKASEARELAQSCTPDVHALLERIYGKIRDAARDGKYEFNLVGGIGPAGRREAVVRQLKADGYRVEDHPNPDPGSPLSTAYTTISW